MSPDVQAYLYWRLCVIPRVLTLKPYVPLAVRKNRVPHPSCAKYGS